MNSRRLNTLGVVVCALFVATAGLLLACRPASIDGAWRIVTVTGDEAYLCTAGANASTQPPTCDFEAGDAKNLPLRGDLVAELIAELDPDRSEVIISAVRMGDAWLLESYEL